MEFKYVSCRHSEGMLLPLPLIQMGSSLHKELFSGPKLVRHPHTQNPTRDPTLEGYPDDFACTERFGADSGRSGLLSIEDPQKTLFQSFRSFTTR